MFADGAEMSLFAHRSYKPDEQLDPIDREIIKRGLARLKLQADGSFLLVDNGDAASGTLVVQVARQRIAREFENAAHAEAEAKARAAKGGDRHDRMLKAIAYSRQLKAEGMQLTQAREIAAKEFGFESGASVRNAEAKVKKKRIE